MEKFSQITLSSWNDIHGIASTLHSFAFRGQSSAKWDLRSSLERSFERYKPLLAFHENKEHWILHEFKERFHLYSDNPPENNNNFEWLALLQHHGCPTRLLDFSKSIYIAAHFALNEAIDDSAIWAVNLFHLKENAYTKLNLTYEKGCLLKDSVNLNHIKVINHRIAQQNHETDIPFFTLPLYSTKHSHRLSRQQGLFLAPMNLGKFQTESLFMKNLALSYSDNVSMEIMNTNIGNIVESELKDNHYVLKIILPKNIQSEARKSLIRMNITEETLFPGLDGLARSMLQKEIRN